MELDKRIKSAGILAKDAFTYLSQLQNGGKQLLKTGDEGIDCHIGGLLPGDCILIGANSGVGKTKKLYDILDSVLNEEVNSNAANIVTLEYALEMKFLNKILRDSASSLSKKKSKILTEAFSEEEKEVMTRYYRNLQDNRRFICEESVSTKDFYEMTKTFCELNKKADSIIVSIDHVLLIKKGDKFEDPLEVLTGYINELRKEYNNVYFILLSQMNRGSLVNIKDKDNSMIPTTAMIYGSSHFEFLCSYIMVIVDPFKLGVNEYLKVNPERYDWLTKFFTPGDKKGKVSFETLGNLFEFILKTRESDVPYRNLHIRKMNLSPEQISKMKQSVVVDNEDSKTKFEMPVFNDSIKNPVDDWKIPQEVINKHLENL
jgi:hypothetical protein